MVKIKNITTETRNKATTKIDSVSTIEMLKLLNKQDQEVPKAIKKELSKIAQVVDLGYKTIKNKGRIIYFGAGTSGRLGVLDASEILPTFGEGNLFVGLIAGGDKALRVPIENAEDNQQLAIDDFKKIKVNSKDLLIGISASGRTPYVLNGLKYGNEIKAQTVAISTSKDTVISKEAKIGIEILVGSEPITGSTRMKSGTAQKLLLNMISTGIMIKYGKVYSNLMVDVKATNEKLYARAVNMIMDIVDIEEKEAIKLFEESGKNVKIAIVMHIKKVTKNEAIKILEQNDNMLRNVLK